MPSWRNISSCWALKAWVGFSFNSDILADSFRGVMASVLVDVTTPDHHSSGIAQVVITAHYLFTLKMTVSDAKEISCWFSNYSPSSLPESGRYKFCDPATFCKSWIRVGLRQSSLIVYSDMISLSMKRALAHRRISIQRKTLAQFHQNSPHVFHCMLAEWYVCLIFSIIHQPALAREYARAHKGTHPDKNRSTQQIAEWLAKGPGNIVYPDKPALVGVKWRWPPPLSSLPHSLFIQNAQSGDADKGREE